jgi:hypothetical protein
MRKPRRMVNQKQLSLFGKQLKTAGRRGVVFPSCEYLSAVKELTVTLQGKIQN